MAQPDAGQPQPAGQPSAAAPAPNGAPPAVAPNAYANDPITRSPNTLGGMMAMGSQPAAAAPPAAAPPQSPVQAANPMAPLPPIDYNRVAARLEQRGYGSMVPGFLGAHTKFLTEQTALAKDKLANGAAALEQSAQLLNGATDQQSYSAVLPQVRALAQQAGLNASAIPDQYDQAKVKAMTEWGTKQADHVRQGYEAADMAQRLALGMPKAVDEWEKSYLQDVAGARNQAELDQKNQKWQALAARDTTGLSTGIVNKLVSPQWTPDLSTLSAISTMKPEDRTKFFQNKLELTSQRLAAAAQQGSAVYAAELARTDPAEASLFPPAPAAGAPFDAAKVGTVAAQAGQTGAQRITAQDTMQWRSQLEDIKLAMLALQRDRAANNPTAQKAALDAAMTKVWTDTKAVKPDATPADAIAFLRDTNRWGEDEQVSPLRNRLITAFQTANKSDLDASHVAVETDNAKNKGKKGSVFSQALGIASPTTPAPTPAPIRTAPQRQQPPESSTAAPPKSAAPPAHQVGDVVSVRGSKVKITKINPDGTFEGVNQ